MGLRAVLAVLLLFCFAGAYHAAAYSIEDTPESSPALTLELEPDKEMYSLDEARAGGVTIAARFTNTGEETVFIVHPGASIPEGWDGKDSFDTRQRLGRSEILVYITTPGGSEVMLRNNRLRGFEPGNRFNLSIMPGMSEEIRLGWFSPYFSLGQWDNMDEPVFTERGLYRIKMVYRNYFRKALTFGRGDDIFSGETPWTGEIESNTISVRVE